MNSTLTQKKETEATIKVNWSTADLEPVVKQVFDRLRPRVKASGFRPGKAPDTIVEREVGSNVLQQEVLEAATTASYSKAIRELKLKAIAPPQVSITKFVPFTELEYTATVEVLPEITLPEYKKIKLTRPAVEVKKEEIDQVIEDLRLRQASKTVKKGAAETGDEVTLDFKGSLDGKALPQATAQNYTARLGSGRLLPGFEEHLIGQSADAEKEFDITLPEDYPDAEVAGKKLHFKVKIDAIWQITLPEVNAEFINQVGPFESEKTLRDDIETKLKVQKEEDTNVAFEGQVLDALLEKSSFKIPDALVHQQEHRLADELKTRAESRGLGWEEYLKLSGKTAEDVEKELKPEAERRVRLAILLTEIAKVENLTLTHAELDNEISRLKEHYNDPKIRQELDSPDGREGVYNHLMSQKVINRLVEYVEGRK